MNIVRLSILLGSCWLLVGATVVASEQEHKNKEAAVQSRCFYCLGEPHEGEKPEDASLAVGVRTFVVWPDAYKAHVRCVGNPIKETHAVQPCVDLKEIADCPMCPENRSATESPFVVFSKVGKDCGHSICLPCYLKPGVADVCPYCSLETSKKSRYRKRGEVRSNEKDKLEARAKYRIDRQAISVPALSHEVGKMQCPYARKEEVVDKAHARAIQQPVDMKKEMERAEVQEKAIADQAAQKGLYKCVMCRSDVTEGQIDQAHRLLHCDAISYSRGGGALEHFVHGGRCSDDIVRLGECPVCKRNLLDSEERECSPYLAADPKVKADKIRRRREELEQASRAKARASGKTQEQINEEEFEEAMRQSMLQGASKRPSDEKERKIEAAAPVVPMASQVGAAAVRTPEDRVIDQMQANFGCSREDLPGFFGLGSLDQLRKAIRDGHINYN